MRKFPIIIVAGGSCSGKTTFVEGFKNAVVVSMDHFYKDISDLKPEKDGRYNFDVPDAFDMNACKKAIETLAQGKSVTIPVYDYVSCKRTGTQIIKAPKGDQIVVLEGIFALCPPLHTLGILRIFIEAPPEIRVARRIKRDVARDRNPQETLDWFINVEKGHQKYIEPSKAHANLIIPFSYSPIVFST
jgi:uridine kinase